MVLAGLLLFGLAGLLSSTSGAAAHERRQVQSFTFVVGWLNEPAYVNLPNAIDLRISRADGTPVTGVEQTLKVEVGAGDKKTEVQLLPRFNTPGAYDGRIVPTATGAYTFRLFGTVEGAQVNETFTAGPNTFGLIEAPNGWPNPLPLTQQLDESIGGLEQRIVNLEGSGRGGNDTALLVAIVALLLGAGGLILGGMSFARGRVAR
jgi:hypothetical protein